MKSQLAFYFAGLLLALPLGTACQSSGHQKADSTAMHMDELRTSVATMKASMSAAAKSLASVVEKANSDPTTPFEQYKKDVGSVESLLSQSEANLKTMRAEGQTYFAEWEKQSATIQDADLKKAAEERRASLSKALEGVTKAMDAARAEIGPYVATLKDVRTYLSNDLTPAGVESIGSKSKRLTKDADSIGDMLDDVIEALEEGAPAFKTPKPPPPPPPETKS